MRSSTNQDISSVTTLKKNSINRKLNSDMYPFVILAKKEKKRSENRLFSKVLLILLAQH